MLLFVNRKILVTTIFSLVLASNSNLEASETTEEIATTQPAGTIGAGMRLGDNISELDVEATLPLWQSPIATVFFAPGFTWYDNDYQDKTVNLGVGMRRVFDDLGIIAGANIYYDSMKSVDGHRYDQLGLGIELMSEWIDASFNYYLPEDTVNKTGDYNTVSQSVKTTAYWDELYGQGYQILQDRKYKKVTTTTTRLFEYFEEPMEGFDLETALKVPGVPAWLETRLLLGWYHYSGSNDYEIEGYKVGCEVRPLRGFAVEAVYYEDDNLHGDNLLVEARASVPFSLENLFKGKNPFSGTKEFFQPSDRNLGDRLLDRVRRDAIVPIQDTGPIENLAAMTIDREVERWAKTHTIMTDVVFVDGANGAEGQNGTFENPFAQVQSGVNAAFGLKNVYVNAFSGQYFENVTLSEGVSLLGSGTLIEGYDSKTFGSGIKPIINGNGKGPVITVTKNNVIDGFHLINTAPVTGLGITETFPDGSTSEDLRQVGIWGNGVSGSIEIKNSTIEATGIGIYLAIIGTTISVTNNTLMQPSASDGRMVKIQSYGNDRVDASFNDNSMTTFNTIDSNWGVMFYSYENSTMNVSFANNQINSAGTALIFNSYDNSSNRARVTDNILSTKLFSGMRPGSSGNGSTHVTFIGNTVNAKNNGIYFGPLSTKPVVLDGYGNTINFGTGFSAVESTWPATAVINNLIHP